MNESTVTIILDVKNMSKFSLLRNIRNLNSIFLRRSDPIAEALDNKIPSIFNINRNVLILYLRFSVFLQGTAQRIALPALGLGRRSRPNRKKLRREKCLGCAQNPQRQVHALLGAE